MMIDLDSHAEMGEDRNEALRPIMGGEAKPLQIGDTEDKTTKIRVTLDAGIEEKLQQLLLKNKDLFTWTAVDMPWIDPEFCCHKLSIDPRCKTVAQKKRRMGPERQEEAKEQVKELLKVGFIGETNYSCG